MKLMEHNEMARAAESLSLHRLASVTVTSENGETYCIRLFL